MTTAFDNDKYIRIQSENIRERIGKFDNKLYLELGGKLFDDLHASRVLPGFMPDSKLQMLTQLQDSLEILIAKECICLNNCYTLWNKNSFKITTLIKSR